MLNLKEIKEAKNFIVDTLHNFKDDVKSVASNISAQDITALSTSPGPAVILSIGLPLIGVYLARKKHDSPLARRIARFLGADVDSINEQFVFAQLNKGEYYNELRKNVLTVITERGDISPLRKMLDLTEGEAWIIFNSIKEIIFSAEVLNQFSIIVPSLEHIKEDVSNIKSNLNSLLEALKSPIKVENDVNNIASELSILERSASVSYIRREEDSELEQAILNNENKIILIIGGPGSGKSKMLYNALMYCKEYFPTFILIKKDFREGDEKGLDLVLSDNDKDNFVIVWDNLHEEDPKFVTDIIERITSIGRSKNFRFIGASRKDIIFVGEEEGIYRVILHKFDKILELIGECSKAFNVKLKPDMTADKIFSKGDGTPYYTISLFKMFKDREITLEYLDQLPSDVIALWRNYLETAVQYSRIKDNHLNAFRSIGLLSHASSEPSQITKNSIREVYGSIFHGDLGKLDYALDDLVDNMFVSWVDEGYYYAHDSHIEALENRYPLEKHHVQDFTKYENDIRNLWAFTMWATYKDHSESMGIISSRIIELDPNYARAWVIKGLALIDLRNHEEAIICYDKVIELEPNRAYSWDGKGRALYGLGRHEEAIVCYDKALEINPNYSDAWNNKGIALSGLGRHEEAISCYDKGLELDPNDAAIWSNKGLALNNLRKHEEAIAFFGKALDINPNDANTWDGKGNALYGLGRHEEAIKCYDKVIELEPNYSGAWNKKGLALGRLGKYEEAIVCYDKAIELEPSDADTWFSKGIALYGLGRHEEAIKCYDKVIELEPNYADAWYNKGSVLSDLSRNEDAIKCYDKVIELEPNYSGAWNNKGLALGNLRKYEEAIKCYDKVIELEPNYADAWYNKGLALVYLSNHEEAIICFDKVIELEPSDLGAWNNKGNALSGLGRHEEAISCYDKALEIDPNYADAWYNRALSNVKKGDTESALADLKKATELDKNNIELAKQDKDFESIRNDERFKALVME